MAKFVFISFLLANLVNAFANASLSLTFDELTAQGKQDSLNIWSQSPHMQFSRKLVYYGTVNSRIGRNVFKCLALAFVDTKITSKERFIHYTSKMWDKEPNGTCDYTKTDPTDTMRSEYNEDLKVKQRIIDPEAYVDGIQSGRSKFRAIEFESRRAGQFDVPGQPVEDVIDIFRKGDELVFSFDNGFDYILGRVPHQTHSGGNPKPLTHPTESNTCTVRNRGPTQYAWYSMTEFGALARLYEGTVYQFTGLRDQTSRNPIHTLRSQIKILQVPKLRPDMLDQIRPGMLRWVIDLDLPVDCLLKLDTLYPRPVEMPPPPRSNPQEVSDWYTVILRDGEQAWRTRSDTGELQWIAKGTVLRVSGTRGKISTRGTRVNGRFIPPGFVNVIQVRITSLPRDNEGTVRIGELLWMEDRN